MQQHPRAAGAMLRAGRVAFHHGLLALVLGAVPAFAQPALLTNAQVQSRAVAGSLDREVKALVARMTEPGWIGYEVPMAPGDRFMCDWDDRVSSRPPATAVKLEPSSIFYVLFRVEGQAVTKIRMFSEGCSIDAGGRPVHWLTGVNPGQSVRLLETFATGADRRLMNGALAAIAMHNGDAAVDTMIGLARTGSTSQVRGQALFWLSQRAGDKAIGAIRDRLDSDPDTDVKKKAVFALSQLPKDEGVPRLIDVARSHSNAAVRKQAMFWLGQSRDPRALAFFQEILAK
jgi:hypothetical protein